MQPLFEIQMTRWRFSGHIPCGYKDPVPIIINKKSCKLKGFKQIYTDLEYECIPVIVNICNLGGVEINLASPSTVGSSFTRLLCEPIIEISMINNNILLLMWSKRKNHLSESEPVLLFLIVPAKLFLHSSSTPEKAKT